MMLVDDGCQAVVEEHAALNPGVAGGRLEGQHEIELMANESFHQVGHRRLADVDLHVRIAAQEGCQRLGHNAGKREGDSDAQVATHHILQFVQSEQTVLSRMERLDSQWQERLTRLGEYDLMAVAQEERLSELVLQLENLVRESALRDKQFTRGQREIQRLGQLGEIFQLSEFHNSLTKIGRIMQTTKQFWH